MTLTDLHAIPEEARADAFRWEELLKPLLAIDGRLTRALHDLARRLEIPEPTLRRKFYAFKKHGLAGLIDRRICGPQAWNTRRTSGLSPQDKNLVKKYCEDSKRGNKAAIRQLLADWRKGVVTSSAPLDTVTGYPVGWSERNLLRAAPTKFEIKAARIGRVAASAHRELVYTTRANLWVGSHYLFDDMWHDHECNCLARLLRGRPLEFHALDLYSANKFAWGMRLRVDKGDGTMEGLKGADMRFLLAFVLRNFGYSPRGTILVAEHGTAAISDQIEKLLAEATGGLVTVERSGMTGAAAAAHQYAGRSKGNFRFKAALESLGNLIHNEMGFLPGQTGKDRNDAPEGQYGLQKYNDALLAAVSQLAPERAAMLRWPILTIQQFQMIAGEIYARINARTEHRLEGWDMNYVPDTRRGGMRRMAPVEVFNRGRRELIPLEPEVIAMILGVDAAEPRTVRNGKIEIEGSEVTGDTLRYRATALREGEKYQAVLNPYLPDELHVFDGKGRFVAVCPRIWSEDRADVEAVERAMGTSKKVEADLLAPLRARHLKQAREKLAMHEHNAAVLSGGPVTPEEKQRAAALKKFVRKQGAEALDDIVEEPAPAPEPATLPTPDQGDDLIDAIL